MRTGNDWLRVHALRRWLVKMERDGPTPAPTPELRSVFAARHAEQIADLRRRTG